MSTSNLKNFGLRNVKSIVVTATPSSVSAALPKQDVDDLMIINSGTKTIFVRTGDENVVADATAMPILGGEKGVYTRGISDPPATHVAAFVATGTQAITFVQGSGV